MVDLKFISKTDPWHKDSLQQSKTQTQNTANLGEEGKSDFHGYHMIRFKCSVSTTKSEDIQRNRKI